MQARLVLTLHPQQQHSQTQAGLTEPAVETQSSCMQVLGLGHHSAAHLHWATTLCGSAMGTELS